MRLIAVLNRRALLGTLIALLLATLQAHAQSFSNDLLRNNTKIIKLFRPVIADATEGTVRVKCDGKDVALGTVVTADGFILTKASELSGKEIVCRLKDGREYSAKLVGVSEEYDLAMLKTDANELKPVRWEDTAAAKVGRFVATVGPVEDPLAIGVISVRVRADRGDQQPKKSAAGGWLGVALEDADGGAKIVVLQTKGPAERAGLKLNDIVTHINSRKVSGRDFLANAIGKHKAGDTIEFKIVRGEEEFDIKAKLEKRPLEGNPQERMGSALSNRRGGFPKILQHDTIIRPTDCGGPLIDLDGKAVGINIARAGRTESYAIPSDAVRELLNPLMTGKLPPPSDEP
jgi:serine protease Do